MYAVLFMKPAPKIEIKENVISVERCDNEDGSQLILWFEDLTGYSYPLEEVIACDLRFGEVPKLLRRKR